MIVISVFVRPYEPCLVVSVGHVLLIEILQVDGSRKDQMLGVRDRGRDDWNWGHLGRQC